MKYEVIITKDNFTGVTRKFWYKNKNNKIVDQFSKITAEKHKKVLENRFNHQVTLKQV